MTAPSAIANAIATLPQAIAETAPFDSRVRPSRPHRTKPASGRSGMRGIRPSTRSPLENVQLVHLDGVLVAIERDDDGESDRNLPCGDADDERRKRLTDEVRARHQSREGDEVQV